MARLPDSARPFYNAWPPRLRPDFRALWHWHSALTDPQPIAANGTAASVDAFFAEEAERARDAKPMRVLREPVWRDAYRVCDAHDLDRGLLAAQVRAAQRLQGRTRFETQSDLEAFVRDWAVAHGRLLAGRAGITTRFQLPYVDELARGFFHGGRMYTLTDDLNRGKVFLPMSDLDQAGVTLDDLRAGTVTEGVRRLLWKQTVRVRDALAQGQPLLKDLRLPLRLTLKYWWLAALEVVSEIERREYDLWSRPLELSSFHRAQVYVQTVFGRASTS